MAAKQTQSKRQVPHYTRSVMLTRFKLSQQKRQLREKERKTSESQSSPIRKSGQKKLKSKGTPSKDTKQKEEFYPNKLKRKIAPKRIVLKSRHELKVIGGNGSCKRKLDLPQKDLKSSPAKRVKTSNTSSDTSDPDRSQSPIYSELGFEEVIRMVDENETLDDDDLLEILTCPSPVWWEDPPDEDYLDGPININSPETTPVPTLSKECRSKASRKKTPHKLILEPENAPNDNKGDKIDRDNVIDDSTFKNINKTDDKFKNKRNKLESLLSSIKNKKTEPKSQNNNINNKNKDEETKENRKDKNDSTEISPTEKIVPNRSKKVSESEFISFANISQQDKDSLKHLENIKIPIEGKSKTILPNTKLEFVDLKKNPNQPLKVFKNLKNLTKYIPNRKLKILNIKKLVTNPVIQKKQEGMNIVVGQSILKELNSTNSESDKKIEIIELDDCNPKIDPNEAIGIKNDNNNQNSSENEKSEPSKENDLTVISISDKLENNEIESKHLEGDKMEEKEQTKTDEIPVKEAKTLNSYYKKCKGRKRDIVKTYSKYNPEVKDIKTAKEESINKESINTEESTELCNNCDKNTKNSIIVPSTTDVKYCLNCSCIFDKDECDYCVRKQKDKEKEAVDNPDGKTNDFHDLSYEDNQKVINLFTHMCK